MESTFSSGQIIFYISILLTGVILVSVLYPFIKKRETEIKLADLLVFRLIHISWIVWTLAFSITISLSPYALFESGSIYNFFIGFLPKDLHGFIIPIILGISIVVGYVVGYIFVKNLYYKCSLSKVKLSILCFLCISLLLILITMNILCATEPSYTELPYFMSVNIYLLLLLPAATFILLYPLYFG